MWVEKENGSDPLNMQQCPHVPAANLECHIPPFRKLRLLSSVVLFIYWLRWVFVAVCGPSLIANNEGSSLL